MKTPSAAKTVLITGAGGGIGSVTAREFAARGWQVAACDLSLELTRELVADIRHAGGHADSYAADIGDAAQVEALFAQLRARHAKLDAAFNNAGIGAGQRIGLAEVTEEDWERTLRINLTGTWRCMKHEIQWMLETGGGAIVNNGSIFSLNGSMSAPYTATKHGIAGLTKSAAIGYAERGVRVNGVCPGLIEAGLGLKALARPTTNPKELIALHPVNRCGTALEVAQAVIWLCSDQASFIHGHMLPVDGGYGAR